MIFAKNKVMIIILSLLLITATAVGVTMIIQHNKQQVSTETQPFETEIHKVYADYADAEKGDIEPVVFPEMDVEIENGDSMVIDTGEPEPIESSFDKNSVEVDTEAESKAETEAETKAAREYSSNNTANRQNETSGESSIVPTEENIEETYETANNENALPIDFFEVE